MKRSAIASLIGIVLSSALLAQRPMAREEGSVASAGTWTCRDGCPSRSRASLTNAVRGPLAEVWSFQVDGAIEGEPLVWKDRVIVIERRGEAERVVHYLDLADGRRIATSRPVKSPLPLEPALWDRLLVIRDGPNSLASYHLGYTRLERRWSWEGSGPVSAPVLSGREIYVRGGDQLFRLEYGRTKAIWESAGRFRGDPVLAGSHIYAVQYDIDGYAQCTILSRADGRAVGKTVIGHHDGQIPPIASPLDVHVRDEFVFVRFPLPVPVDRGSARNAVQLTRKLGLDRPTLEIVGFHDLHAPPTLGRKQALVRMTSSQYGEAWVRVSPAGEGLLLASATSHDFLLRRPGGAALAGADVLAAGFAFDLGTLQLQRRDESSSDDVVVPARDTLLVKTGERKLRALRSTTARQESWSPGRSEKADAVVAVPKGVVVLRDGTVERGDLSIGFGDGDEVVLDRGRGRTADFSLSQVRLVEDEAGRPVHWGSVGDGLEALEILQTEVRRDGLDLLLRRAGNANSSELLANLVESGEAVGVKESRLESARKKLQAWRAKPPRAKDELILEIKGLARGMDARALDVVASRLAKLPDSAPRSVRMGLIGALLEQSPAHPELVRSVRALLPADLELPQPFVPGDWIDFATALQRTPVQIIPPPDPKGGNTWDQRELGRAHASWRRRPADRVPLVGLRSERLFIASPVENPARIARCLSVGEMVCETLESIFAEGTVRRGESLPLRLHLYGSKESYQAQSAERGLAGMEWSAGYYSPDERICRLYLPADAEDFQESVSTYAHELTHQWLEERCPLYSTSDIEHHGGPGFWIVEGFASLVEEFTFDVVAGTVQTESPQAESIDVLAHARDDQLMPWQDFFRLSIRDRSRIPSEPDDGLRVAVTWQLGAQRGASWMNVFYWQSTAVCQYLFHAENGRHRAALLEYVESYYTADRDGLDLQECFGMSPDELGLRARVYARERMGIR